MPGHTARLVGTASGSARWLVYLTGHSPAFDGIGIVFFADGVSVDAENGA